MGAGLDTFAYRNPYRENVLRVFEVDHPATQTWKRSCLKESGIPLPTNLTFVPVDFTTQTLAEELRNAGFDPGKCTFFSWLGVTEYLTTEAVMATLRFVASAQKGSGIVFNYMILPSLLTSANERPSRKSRSGSRQPGNRGGHSSTLECLWKSCGRWASAMSQTMARRKTM